MKVTQPHITELIPQRAPVVMIDNLLDCSDNGAHTDFLIRPDNIFCKEGFFLESGIIENIAQTAAAQIGYLYREKNIPVPIGFIGAVKNLEIIKLPKAGSTVNTIIKIENEVLGVTLITGKTYMDSELLASLEMKIVIKK